MTPFQSYLDYVVDLCLFVYLMNIAFNYAIEATVVLFLKCNLSSIYNNYFVNKVIICALSVRYVPKREHRGQSIPMLSG